MLDIREAWSKGLRVLEACMKQCENIKVLHLEPWECLEPKRVFL